MQINIEKLLEIAKNAGDEILKVYNSDDFNIEQKEDDSPLTKADLASNEVIKNGLIENFPDIPIVSEEDKEIDYQIRKDYNSFWCVDPLDGTKEFIKRNGEFTVNIALIKDSYPELAVIYAPVLDTFWWSDGNRAYKRVDGKTEEIKVNPKDKEIITVASRSHIKPEDAEFYAKFDVKESKSRGSSLKFCLVAEGSAQLYKRSGPTMEWDTASGQAIVEAAGGFVTLESGERFIYNKENLLNPGFIVAAKKYDN